MTNIHNDLIPFHWYSNWYCSISFQLGNLSSGKHWCGLVLELDPDNIDALCDRAELYISQQMYEEAIKDFQKAKEIENHPQKVHDQHAFVLEHENL